MNVLKFELKKGVLSKPFIIYCILVVTFAFINCQQILDYPLSSNVYQPKNMITYTDDKHVIMRNAIHQLKEEVHHNNFKTYQLGFLKQKRLNQKQLIQIKCLLLK
ncbi:hypothetical protein [Staphylococcus saccharolyticus]|uniref:Membrane protein n=1 Tax=Staphylococcus saccharolyticus TaxID=33028 RepID=A0A380GWM8_9STAP|nr:hypothetical protein [Staphylococcus saccharolyticus]SUM67400.1 membrane protein [Staphylococcus saccharolyticus]